MEQKTILVIFPLDLAHRRQLEAIAPNAKWIYAGTDDILTPETMENVSIIIGNPRRRLLPQAKKLEWLQLGSAGADLYVKPGMLQERTVLTNATGSFGLAMSEYMIAVVLNLFLNLPRYRVNQENRVWRNEGPVRSIYGSTALSVGLGDIGREFAARFHALGGHVVGVRRSDRNKPDFVDELLLIDELDKALPRADVVALSLPETPETIGLFSKERLALMKPGAVLLNVGRGTAVDTDALCDALNSGRLGGAAVDVTDPEPLPPGHPLWSAKNILITPHISGCLNLPETSERVFLVFAENLNRYFSGLPLKNIVDRKTGYKKHGS